VKIDDALVRVLPREVAVLPVIAKVDSMQIMVNRSTAGGEGHIKGIPIKAGTKWPINNTYYVTPAEALSPYILSLGVYEDPATKVKDEKVFNEIMRQEAAAIFAENGWSVTRPGLADLGLENSEKGLNELALLGNNGLYAHAKGRKNLLVLSVDLLREEIADVPNAPRKGRYFFHVQMTAVLLAEERSVELWRKTEKITQGQDMDFNPQVSKGTLFLLMRDVALEKNLKQCVRNLLSASGNRP
jgi:hypothetical protein